MGVSQFVYPVTFLGIFWAFGICGLRSFIHFEISWRLFFFKYYFCPKLSLSSPSGTPVGWFPCLLWSVLIFPFLFSLCFSLGLFFKLQLHCILFRFLNVYDAIVIRLMQMNPKLYSYPSFAWLTLSHHLDFTTSEMTSLVSKMRQILCSTLSKHHTPFLLRTHQRCHFAVILLN